MFSIRKKIKENDLIKEIYNTDRVKRYFSFLLGILLSAISFNLFILPNNIVYGMSGIGVILKDLIGIDPSIVIMIGNVILLFLSYFLLGKEKTSKTVVGAILYPIFVSLTSEIVKYIDVSGAESLVQVLFGAVLSGFAIGLIFKSGFTSGGTDILNEIFSKYFKTSIGNAMIFTDGIIIISGVFVFGWTKLMYSLITLYIISLITDKVILGISESKSFYIITDKEKEVKEFIMTGLNHGVTSLESRGGFTGKKQAVLMCIIPTSQYFLFKEGIHKIDKDAFFVVTDAYEVHGGE